MNDDKNHKRKRQATNESPDITMSCSDCGLAFPSRNQLFRHLRHSEKCCFDKQNNSMRDDETQAIEFQKIVLVLAYLGKAYHGSARNDCNDCVPTVEGCLWKAISQALQQRQKPIINKSSSITSFALQIQQKTNPKGMTRSSRTDKGVSALGNVYSFLLPLEGVLKLKTTTEDSLASAINDHLPFDIRLLRAMMSNEQRQIPLSFNARTCCEARRYRYLIPSKVLFQKNQHEEPQKESILDLRKRLKQVLLQWRGTHSFHNFTNWKPKTQSNTEKGNNDDDQESPSCFRHILRCHVEDVIQHNQTDFVVISIKGQSFLYHQIRKMMGATIGVMNLSLSTNFIPEALREEETTIQVPLAPAEGLVLAEAMYSKYCSKHKVEPIGLGTKLLHRDTTKDGGCFHNPKWEASAVKLTKETAEFQKCVYEQICKDQAAIFSVL